MVLKSLLWVGLLLVNSPSITSSPLSTTAATPTTTINILGELEDVEHHTLAPGTPKIELLALQFVKDVNNKSFKAYNDFAQASWNYETNITDETEAAKAKAEADNYKFEADIQKDVEKRFPNWESFQDPVVKRMFSNFAVQGPGNMSEEHIDKMTEILSKMETAYATTTICDFHDKKKCDLRLDRDINKKLAGSKDFAEKNYYWTEWHNAMSKEVPPTLYQTFVEYQNEMAQANDFDNMGEMWITQYNDYSDDWTAEGFKDEIIALEEEIRPVYNTLHAYIRMKLKKMPEYADKIPSSGLLPIALLGNMWGQDWTSLDSTKPYPEPEVTSVHATKALKKAGYTVERLFREADQFFSDLGLLRVPESFWKLSRLERPKDNRNVVCHPSAWSFSNGTDVRITMCAEVTLDDLLTAHHEMGHIQYYLQYRNLPHVFQDGANPGFHEAIGDSLALSIMTPVHLQCRLKLDLGLESICNSSENSISQSMNSPISEMEMNFLYLTALQKVPFLPFSYVLETWRWKAFNLSITAKDYNKEWWKMRESLQGILPPGDRSAPNLFDPASKFHIIANEPYISYFISYILQFQFYEAMCKAASQYEEGKEASIPLHRCDISGSKQAGKLLGNMMKMGCSTDWRTALEVMTGSRNMSAKPLLNYFKPLTDYMQKELKKNNEPACYGEYCQQQRAS